ncbi:hypothetical protein U0070_005737 [Myodes glareolus]|uniref:60S ribosomal protein L29 n=1 Tax=Myodes glareolus TaxID=447135 RepID=A0AAW0HNK1_MYOGA
MHLAKKHSKDLQKVQANKAKAKNVYTEAAVRALGKPKAVKPTVPKGPGSKLSHLASITLPKVQKQKLHGQGS